MELKFCFQVQILICVVTLGGEAQFNIGGDYNKMIAEADIFYINSEPNQQPKELRISDVKQLKSKESIKVIIHGFTANRNHVSIAPVRNAYLAVGHDPIFIADWDEASHIIYTTARYFVKPVGIRFAKLLKKFMSVHNVDSANIHLIGHSLGSHIAGNIGRYLNGTIGRITGLDPASPLFEDFVPDGLRSSDAQFVDNIHTDSPILGSLLRRGHIDFYPNYGSVSQPGCGTLDVITFSACSHYRAPIFFAESIVLPKHFPASQCALKSIERRKCQISNDVVFMGEKLSTSARGTYFVETNNVPPYGLGAFSKIYGPQFKIQTSTVENTIINDDVEILQTTDGDSKQ